MRMAYARAATVIATPIGPVRIEADGDMLTNVRIGDDADGVGSDLLQQAAVQIAAYFEGRLTVFDLPLVPAATVRGQALRDAMLAIPFGQTLSYGALATRCGSSARAIGQACARNPFPIIVPCHRVLDAGGRLGAYSAGDGPATKQWLLNHEDPGSLLI